MPKTNYKLNSEQRMHIFRMHAEGCTPTEIKKELYQRWEITHRTDTIAEICRSARNQPFIDKFRDDYLARIKHVPIANKRVRIDDLEKLRQELWKSIKDLPKKTKSGRSELSSLAKRLTEILTTAQDEMEKKPNLVAGVVMGSLSGKTDAELQEEKRQLLTDLGFSGQRKTSETEDNSEGTDPESQE